MTDRPILFSAPMVRALLAGTKTQTRRVIKQQPPAHVVDFCTFHNPKGDGLAHFGFDSIKRELQDWFAVCPYGQPGDRLWVREAWTTHAFLDSTSPRDLKTRSIHYQADGQIKTGKTRPSIHMPRWASRITLEITGVRVERLQDISDADSLAEGVDRTNTSIPGYAKERYRQLWETINGPGSWEANPWVWVVEFKGVAQ